MPSSAIRCSMPTVCRKESCVSPLRSTRLRLIHVVPGVRQHLFLEDDRPRIGCQPVLLCHPRRPNLFDRGLHHLYLCSQFTKYRLAAHHSRLNFLRTALRVRLNAASIFMVDLCLSGPIHSTIQPPSDCNHFYRYGYSGRLISAPSSSSTISCSCPLHHMLCISISFHPSVLGDGPRPESFVDQNFFLSSSDLFGCGVRRGPAYRALLKAAWEFGIILQPSNENAASCYLLDLVEQYVWL